MSLGRASVFVVALAAALGLASGCSEKSAAATPDAAALLQNRRWRRGLERRWRARGHRDARLER
jgi:hypothetical protein